MPLDPAPMMQTLGWVWLVDPFDARRSSPNTQPNAQKHQRQGPVQTQVPLVFHPEIGSMSPWFGTHAAVVFLRAHILEGTPARGALVPGHRDSWFHPDDPEVMEDPVIVTTAGSLASDR